MSFVLYENVYITTLYLVFVNAIVTIDFKPAEDRKIGRGRQQCCDGRAALRDRMKNRLTVVLATVATAAASSCTAVTSSIHHVIESTML